MAWNDFSIAVGGMLTKEGYGYNPKKKSYTKMVGNKAVVVDVNNEEVYFFDGSDKCVDDLDGVLSGISDEIEGIIGAQVVKPDEPLVKNDIEETETVSEDDPEKLTPEMVVPANVPSKYEHAQDVELTIDIVKQYINEKVTDEEAYSFIQLCKARHLNPFLKQVHLIKKEFTGAAKTVVGKDVFMERAGRHPQYDGFEAGIIIKAKGKTTTEDRPGAFLDDGETLVGGWAKVYRKDQSHCTEARVSMNEYNTGMSSWKKIPATMIRKVGLTQAQREAFAAELSGLYDSSEIGVDT